MLKVDASRLPYPKIQYKNGSHIIEQHKAKWNLEGKQFLSTNKRPVPYVVLHERYVDPDHITQIRQNFDRQLQGLGVGTPDHLETVRLSSQDDIRKGLREAQNQKAALVILVLQQKSQNTYSSFKYLADRVFGIPSIVMVTSNNQHKGNWNPQGLNQYIGNIMMKANLKMGGINHSAVSNSGFGNIEKWLESTLVLGADVTHPSNGALLGCPSVAALVVSVENTGGRFLGSLSLQTKGKKEVSSFVRLSLRLRLTSTDH
jgi:eukaryotic translation initiation factor 2C